MGVNLLKTRLNLYLSIITGKLVRGGLKRLGKTATALPGNIALRIEPDLLKILRKRCKKVVLITGTNGKTTTNNLICHIIRGDTEKLLSNLRGANMPQGITSSFIENYRDEYDWGIFEVDEGSFRKIAEDLRPEYIVVTNFFRDQLDRYGEIESTVSMVEDAIKPLDTTLILNADDPLVSQFEQLKKNNIFYGVGKNKFSTETKTVVESQFCPLCSGYIDYEYFNYGQLGSYHCKTCGFENPDYDYYLTNIDYHNQYSFDVMGKEIVRDVRFKYGGTYNLYNVCAAFAFCLEAGMDPEEVLRRVESFDYKLGRMEEFNFHDKVVKVVLVKNPIGLTEVVNTIYHDEREKSILFILNDNPADGRDVSWIWDARMDEVNQIEGLKTVQCSGRRAEDIATRLKYDNLPVSLIKVDDNIKASIEQAVNQSDVEIVYILPTYTAVFQTRDILLKIQERNQKWN
jgi:UDP-N-acetylmuramyl tripeptide synthase